jgi:hypothetical protein
MVCGGVGTLGSDAATLAGEGLAGPAGRLDAMPTAGREAGCVTDGSRVGDIWAALAGTGPAENAHQGFTSVQQNNDNTKAAGQLRHEMVIKSQSLAVSLVTDLVASRYGNSWYQKTILRP